MTPEAKESPGIGFVGRILLETPEDYVAHAIDCVALAEGDIKPPDSKAVLLQMAGAWVNLAEYIRHNEISASDVGCVALRRRTREDLMQISNYQSVSSHDLLDCRMAMLGLDLSAVESRDGAMFEAIRQRCANCNFREPCELDLKRDPNDPVWETYCPNTATLIALPEACWLGPR